MKKSSVKKAKKNTSSSGEFRTVFIRCDCDNEVLVVRYDKEFDLIDICMYETQNSFKHKMSLWQKIRYVYQLIKDGQPYTDQIILQRDQIEELKGLLNSI